MLRRKEREDDWLVVDLNDAFPETGIIVYILHYGCIYTTRDENNFIHVS
jgi:hypothetical protein